MQLVRQSGGIKGAELKAIKAAFPAPIAAANLDTIRLEGDLPARESSPHSKILEAYSTVIKKLFVARDDGKERCLYRHELEKSAKGIGCSAHELVEHGLQELWLNGNHLGSS